MLLLLLLLLLLMMMLHVVVVVVQVLLLLLYVAVIGFVDDVHCTGTITAIVLVITAIAVVDVNDD